MNGQCEVCQRSTSLFHELYVNDCPTTVYLCRKHMEKLNKTIEKKLNKMKEGEE